MAEYLKIIKDNELMDECGDISIPDVCRYVLAYSPYHVDVPNDLHTDVMLLVGNDDIASRQHSYKFVAKLRSSLKKNVVVIKNLAKASDNERYAHGLAFLIKSLYKTKEDES